MRRLRLHLAAAAVLFATSSALAAPQATSEMPAANRCDCPQAPADNRCDCPVTSHPAAAPTDSPQQRSVRAPVLFLAGAGAAGIVVGAVAGAMTFSWAGDLRQPVHSRGEYAEQKEIYSRARLAGAISTGGFIVGAIFLASSAAIYFVSTKEKTVRAGFGPGTAVLHASF